MALQAVCTSWATLRPELTEPMMDLHSLDTFQAVWDSYHDAVCNDGSPGVGRPCLTFRPLAAVKQWQTPLAGARRTQLAGLPDSLPSKRDDPTLLWSELCVTALFESAAWWVSHTRRTCVSSMKYSPPKGGVAPPRRGG